MNGTGKGTLLVLALTACALATVALTSDAQTRATGTAPQAAPAVPPRTAGEAFKNVQVLKSVQPDELVPAMQFITAALGVECDFCHTPPAFEKDDKETKRTARKMMQMMTAINAANFEGEREVTCYSCHRGSNEPLTIPVIAEAAAVPSPEADKGGAAGAPTATAAPGPTADQLVDKWVQASGGAAALARLSSRVQTGTLTAGGGRESPIEIFAKAPDKRLSVTHMPNRESITAYDGRIGWLTGREGPHEMSAAEADAARLDADFCLPLHVKELFGDLSVLPAEKLGERDAYLVVASRPGRPPVKLHLDAQTGLLLRLERYMDTPLGFNPTQIDYADYRQVDGVTLPFRWTLARPGGRFTIQVSETRHNVAIEDAKFAMPAPPPAEPKPPAR